MANKTYSRKYEYDPSKKGKTAGMYNQGYHGSYESEFDYSKETQEARKDKRLEKFKQWVLKDNRVSRSQLEKDPMDQIGAVSSSWLTSLGYNAAAGEAVATFKDSDAEFYYKMSYELFLDWLNSPSKGRWLYEHPQIMHDYTMRGTANEGEITFGERIEKFHKKNRLVKRGDKARLKKRLDQIKSKWR